MSALNPIEAHGTVWCVVAVMPRTVMVTRNDVCEILAISSIQFDHKRRALAINDMVERDRLVPSHFVRIGDYQ
jgi:hypothetical protein